MILNSFANADDAAKAFKNGTASAKTVHQDGTVQFADLPGKTLTFDSDRLLAEVRWATAKGATKHQRFGCDS